MGTAIAAPKPSGMARPATEMAREALAFFLATFTSNSMATMKRKKTMPMVLVSVRRGRELFGKIVLVKL